MKIYENLRQKKAEGVCRKLQSSIKIVEYLRLIKANVVFHNIFLKKLRILKNIYE